jgi:Mn-dependent DtxR family transcriptional regulator
MVEYDSTAALKRIRELLGIIDRDPTGDVIYTMEDLVKEIKELDERLTSGTDSIPNDWDARYKI